MEDQTSNTMQLIVALGAHCDAGVIRLRKSKMHPALLKRLLKRLQNIIGMNSFAGWLERRERTARAIVVTQMMQFWPGQPQAKMITLDHQPC